MACGRSGNRASPSTSRIATSRPRGASSSSRTHLATSSTRATWPPGASTADVAILLIDARNGVRTQSKRHAKIARLLGITNFVLAINKMDLVDFDREVYEKILDDFSEFLTGASVHAIPMSALEGDNVITRSERTPYFDGLPLLEYLETVQVHRNAAGGPFRFPVQMVLRPDQEFRGYAGQIVSGTVRPGDRVTAWPSGRSARVKRIVTYDGDLALGFAPMSVTLTLDDEIDISRGDVLTVEPAFVGQRFEAELVWMDERPLDPGRVYLLKHSTRTVTAEVNHALVLNQIGSVQISTARPHRVRSLCRESRDRQLHPDRSGHAVHVRRRDDHRSRSNDCRGAGCAADLRRTTGSYRPAGRFGSGSRGGYPQSARGNAHVSSTRRTSGCGIPGFRPWSTTRET